MKLYKFKYANWWCVTFLVDEGLFTPHKASYLLEAMSEDGDLENNTIQKYLEIIILKYIINFSQVLTCEGIRKHKIPELIALDGSGGVELIEVDRWEFIDRDMDLIEE